MQITFTEVIGGGGCNKNYIKQDMHVHSMPIYGDIMVIHGDIIWLCCINVPFCNYSSGIDDNNLSPFLVSTFNILST